MDYGKKIIDLREKKGWTQYRLHKIANIQQPTLSRIEAGTTTPTTENLSKIATALGVSMAVFDDKPNPVAIDRIIDYMDNNINDNQQREKAAQIFKSMSPEQQQQLYQETKEAVLSDEEIMKTLKSLPAERRKALEIIIQSFAQNQR